MRLITECSYKNLDKLASEYDGYNHKTVEEVKSLAQAFILQSMIHAEKDAFSLSIRISND
jgi:hypothetical protein